MKWSFFFQKTQKVYESYQKGTIMNILHELIQFFFYYFHICPIKKM